MTSTITESDRILRIPQVVELTGLSRSSIMRRVRRGAFPARRYLGSRMAVGFLASEVTGWIESQPFDRPGAWDAESVDKMQVKNPDD